MSQPKLSEPKLSVLVGSLEFPDPGTVTERIESKIVEVHNKEPNKKNILLKFKDKPEYKNAIKRFYTSEKTLGELIIKVDEILKNEKNEKDEEIIDKIIENIVNLENNQASQPYGRLIGFLTPPEDFPATTD
tara:strand:+ start:55 stop:450 length:396 start_codon:yes stop_codon:yes gene_type:complete